MFEDIITKEHIFLDKRTKGQNMSNMDLYKKKYKEAMDRMELCVRSGLKITPEYIFPELAESEDEKVRKEIITFIKKRDRSGCDYDYDKWIAWLEKQEGCEHIRKEWLEHIKQSWYKEGFIDGKYSGGTSKEWTINDTTTLNELIDFLENGTAKLQHDLTRYANWLKIQFTPIEKQGEQKPADKVEPKFKVGDKIRRKTPSSFDKDMQVARIEKDYYVCNHIGKFSSEVVPFSKQSSYELIEQNPAWSEEDEKMLQGIWDEILANKHDAKECEWKTYDKFLDWLKSLKPQNHWKPSDNELEVLRLVAEKDGTCLMGLYEQLKKLKED